MRFFSLKGWLFIACVLAEFLPGCLHGAIPADDLAFPALTNNGEQPPFVPISVTDRFPRHPGQPASIIHVDSQGHATVEPIDFLKGHSLLGWDVATLDQVATCEKSPDHADELVLKYYKNKVLAQAFQLSVTDYMGELRVPDWMLLLPDKNCLILNSPRIDGEDLIRFDLKTGARRELKYNVPTNTDNTENWIQFGAEPVWDAKEQKLIMEVRQKVSGRIQESLALLDPDTLTFQVAVPIKYNTSINELLAYNPKNDSVIFYGTCDGIFTRGGTTGFYEMSLHTGDYKLLMEESSDIDRPGRIALALLRETVFGAKPMPAAPMIGVKYIAMLNSRYVVMMRANLGGLTGPEDEVDPHAYLIDLQANNWKVMTGLNYFTWPIGQNGVTAK